MSVKYLYLIAAAAILGCAPAKGTGDTPGTPPIPRRANYLSGEEIVNAHADATTAFDAVARLRPNWLAPHGPMSSNPQASEFATVFVDGQPVGDISALRGIPAFQVADIRYYNIAEAGAAFGVRGGVGGVIDVSTR